MFFYNYFPIATYFISYISVLAENIYYLFLSLFPDEEWCSLVPSLAARPQSLLFQDVDIQSKIPLLLPDLPARTPYPRLHVFHWSFIDVSNQGQVACTNEEHRFKLSKAVNTAVVVKKAESSTKSC